MKTKVSKWWSDTIKLFRSIPSVIVAIFVVSVVAMNILSNKTIYESEFLAIDAGFLVSWVSFLVMDLVTIHFGPKASIKLSVFAIIVNLVVSLAFYLTSLIPTKTDYSAFNSVVGGTWFILLSSSIAFIVSAVVNSFLNFLIGKSLKNKNKPKTEFFLRSYVSTIVGQIVDNLTFSMLTFMLFAPIFWDGFHWTLVQCLTCSILFGFIEFFMEMLFSPLAYRISRNWTKSGIGYIEE